MIERNRKDTEPIVIEVNDLGVPMPLQGFKAIATLFNPDNTSIRWKKVIDPIPDPELCIVCVNPDKPDFDIPKGEYEIIVEIESATQHYTPFKDTIKIL